MVGPGGAGSVARYRVVRLLGRGAMGEVHEAVDLELDRRVALKAMDDAVAADPVLSKRFRAEARLTAGLDHPGIVPIYDMEEGERPRYAMKLVRGRTLEALLDEARAAYDRGGRPEADNDLKARLEVFLDICDAMAHAHERGIVHRDLKPENVMVGAFHEVLVMDWGIARPIGGPEPLAAAMLGEGQAHRTQLGVAIGTPPYMSPEQAEGRNEQLDGRSDQYALGLLLFEIVTLRRAITGRTVMEMVFRAAEGEKDPMVHHARDAIPRELRAIVDKATAFRPEDRYADVQALAADVRRYLRDQPVLARPDAPPQRVLRWIGHHRHLALGAVTGLVAMLAVGTLAAALLGFGAFHVQRGRALAREARVTDALAAASRQAHRLDSRIQREVLRLAALAGVAEGRLALGAELAPTDLDAALGGSEVLRGAVVLSSGASARWPADEPPVLVRSADPGTTACSAVEGGEVLRCRRAILDGGGEPAGTAAIDVSVPGLVALLGDGEGLLVDRGGRVLASTTGEVGLPLDAIAAAPRGHLEQEGALYAWSPLQVVDWTWVRVSR